MSGKYTGIIPAFSTVLTHLHAGLFPEVDITMTPTLEKRSPRANFFSSFPSCWNTPLVWEEREEVPTTCTAFWFPDTQERVFNKPLSPPALRPHSLLSSSEENIFQPKKSVNATSLSCTHILRKWSNFRAACTTLEKGSIPQASHICFLNALERSLPPTHICPPTWPLTSGWHSRAQRRPHFLLMFYDVLSPSLRLPGHGRGARMYWRTSWKPRQWAGQKHVCFWHHENYLLHQTCCANGRFYFQRNCPALYSLASMTVTNFDSYKSALVFRIFKHDHI